MSTRQAPVTVSLVLLFAALAGCFEDQDEDRGNDDPVLPDIPADWYERALAGGTGHDHTDPVQHQGLSTPNFGILGWDPLVSGYDGKSAGTYYCGGVSTEGERRIAAVHSFDSDVALMVADVTDPAAPTVLGELVIPLVKVYDSSVTQDGRFAVLATNPRDRELDGLPVTFAPAGRGGCADAEPNVDPTPYQGGVLLVDLADPSKPEVVDHRPLPGFGAHSVFTTTIDGKVWVLASVTNLAKAASTFHFYRVTSGPLGPVLSEEAVYRPPQRTADDGVFNFHGDGWIQKHPVTDRLLAYLADWNGGMIVVDISGDLPQELGRWNNHDPTKSELDEADDDSGSIHGAYPLEGLWDGKHYTIIGQEVLLRPEATPTGVVYVLDTTDPSAPIAVSGWTLPAEPAWDELLLFSTHYFRVVEKTMFVAMYHGGLWAVDLSDITQPRSIGVFMPDRVPEQVPAYPGPAPEVLDSEILPDGTLVVFDGYSGLYTVRFDPSIEAPAPADGEWVVPLE